MYKLAIIEKIFIFLLLTVNMFGFTIGNMNFNKSLENGYREFIIYNEGTETVRYRPYITTVEGDEDVKDAIELYPRILTVPPKTSKILKMFGKSKKPLESREYKFYLDFDNIIIPTLTKNKDGKTINGSATMPLSPRLQLSGYGGEIDWQNSIKLENVRFIDTPREYYMEVDVVNNAYAAIELGMKFYNYNKSSMTSKGVGIIPKQSRKRVLIPLRSFRDKDIIKHIEFYNDEYIDIKSDEVDFRSAPEVKSKNLQ